jgi:hypothetical protein
LSHKTKRGACAIETHRGEHCRIGFDLVDAIRCDVQRIDLGSSAFGFAEVDAFAVG